MVLEPDGQHHESPDLCPTIAIAGAINQNGQFRLPYAADLAVSDHGAHAPPFTWTTDVQPTTARWDAPVWHRLA